MQRSGGQNQQEKQWPRKEKRGCILGSKDDIYFLASQRKKIFFSFLIYCLSKGNNFSFFLASSNKTCQLWETSISFIYGWELGLNKTICIWLFLRKIEDLFIFILTGEFQNIYYFSFNFHQIESLTWWMFSGLSCGPPRVLVHLHGCIYSLLPVQLMLFTNTHQFNSVKCIFCVCIYVNVCVGVCM